MLSVTQLSPATIADGSLEQMLLRGHGAFVARLVLAKALAHWLVTGLPLVLVAPLFGAAVRHARRGDRSRSR